MTEQPQELWPLKLAINHDRNQLKILFNNDESFDLSAEYLRVVSPSAKTQGHSEKDRVLEYGKKNVLIVNMEPVGNYAVRIIFSDNHDTGFYSWAYLYELGTTEKDRWQAYLAELEEAGLLRDG